MIIITKGDVKKIKIKMRKQKKKTKKKNSKVFINDIEYEIKYKSNKQIQQKKLQRKVTSYIFVMIKKINIFVIPNT